jgi:hypothetical protein
MACCLSSSLTDCDEHKVEGGLGRGLPALAWRDETRVFLLTIQCGTLIMLESFCMCSNH